MNLDDFEKMLVDIQNNTSEAKILNSIMILAKELAAVEKALVTTQDKINQMIVEINATKERLMPAETEVNTNE